jgi:hypothetical protein
MANPYFSKNDLSGVRTPTKLSVSVIPVRLLKPDLMTASCPPGTFDLIVDKPVLRPVVNNYVTANGQRLQCIGQASMTVMFAEHVFEHDIIVGGVKCNLIGEDFITMYRRQFSSLLKLLLFCPVPSYNPYFLLELVK